MSRDSPPPGGGRLSYRPARALVFVMPFASPAASSHAEKLIDCILPSAEQVVLLGDYRIGVTRVLPGLSRMGRFPVLHYVRDRRPTALSVMLWLLKLVWIELTACAIVVRERRRFNVLICALGSYSAPVLVIGRLAGMKTAVFDPGSDATQAATMGRFAGGLRFLAAGMHAAAHYIYIESPRLAAPMGLKSAIARVRQANLYVDQAVYFPGAPVSKRMLKVCFVGRLVESKHVLDFIAAAQVMMSDGVSVEILGDGPQRPDVEMALKERHLPAAIFRGWLTGPDLAATLREARLVVLPSDGEGMPNAVIEAMACGAIVVATPVGAIPDVIEDGVTGYTLRGVDAGSIVEGVRRALAAPDVDAVSVRAHDRILRQFSVDSCRARWAALLAELAGNAPPGHSYS